DAVRRATKRTLEQFGYLVLDARDAEAAFQASEREAGPIHLVVSDVVMPGASGPEIVERILGRRPGAGVLYMSGYAVRGIRSEVTLPPGSAFIQKPFAAAHLARQVRELLDARPGSAKPAQPLGVEAGSARGASSVLVIDDDPALLRTLSR